MGNGRSSPAPIEQVEYVDFVEPGTEDKARAAAKEAFENEIKDENDKARKDYKRSQCKEMKRQLMGYKMGTKLSLSEKFGSSGIDSINIGLIGPTGAGKSSLIGLAQLLFTGKINVETQDTGKEGTIFLETYFDGNGFRILDTRGFHVVNHETIKEIQRIINGEIKPDEHIKRPKDNFPEADRYSSGASGEQPLEDRVHVVVIIVDIQDPRRSQYMDSLKELKDFCKVKGLETVCVFVSNEEHARISDGECQQLAGRAGAASDRVFKIKNHIALGTESRMSYDYDSQLDVLNVLDTAILAGERFLKFTLQRMRNATKKKVKRGTKTLRQMFEEITEEHGLPSNKLHGFLRYLESESVSTPNLLLESWDDLDPSELPSVTVQRWIKQKLEV